MIRRIDEYFVDGENLAVIFGGRGAEHSVSRLGAANFIREAESLGIRVLPIFVDKIGRFNIFLGGIFAIGEIDSEILDDALLPTFPVMIGKESGFLCSGRVIRVRLAVPLLHGDFGEDGRVQGALECAGIEFVGADAVSGALMADKAYSKAVAVSVGVRTLPWMVITDREWQAEGDGVIERVLSCGFAFPLFIKPARLGSSIGASIAKTEAELASSLKGAFSVSDRVMIEPALMDKRELECAYFDVPGEHIVTPPGEISVRSGFYDFDKKYFDGGEVKLSPVADVPPSVSDEVRLYTERLSLAFGTRHIARFDYFLSGGEVFFNEVNAFPGMTESSLYAAMLDAAGLSSRGFISRLWNSFDRRI